MTDSTAELEPGIVERAGRGDAAAFRQLVLRYHRPVYALLWRMLEASHSQQDVEDLTQETFLRVYRGLERFDPQGPARLSTWILTIASRLALNARRGSGRRPRAPLSCASQLPAAEQADAATRQRQLVRLLRDAIQALPTEQRLVLLLRQYHELSYQQIAAATDCTLGTVKSRLARAKAALQQALQEVDRG